MLQSSSECVFCKIVSGELPSAKIWENEEFLAILDKFPNVKGQTLLITKKHYNSDVFSLDKELYLRLFEAAREVAKLLERGLGVKRVAMVVEGMGVNHIHIKLYPLWGLKDKFEEFWVDKKVFFEKYEGYITTLLGPEKSLEELEKVAEEIRKA